MKAETDEFKKKFEEKAFGIVRESGRLAQAPTSAITSSMITKSEFEERVYLLSHWDDKSVDGVPIGKFRVQNKKGYRWNSKFYTWTTASGDSHLLQKATKTVAQGGKPWEVKDRRLCHQETCFDILNEFHSNGHPKAGLLHNRVKLDWANISEDACRKFVELCPVCSLKKTRAKPIRQPMKCQMESAPILAKFLNGGIPQHPAVKSLEDCIVGPSASERIEGAPSWYTRNLVTQAGVKRKLSAPIVDSTFETAVQKFLESGCCVIPNAIPKEFVTKCHQKATSDLEMLQDALKARKQNAGTDPHLLAAAHRIDYEELVARDGGRRDVRFDLFRYPFAAPGLSYNAIILPLVRELLGGGEISLLYEGVMWAEPNHECHQKWHADGGHLFHHEHQPPHCINVFLPLIDLTAQHGPTEVIPGSHILGSSNTEERTIELVANAGDAILFDYRLQHRGRSNICEDEARPILYLAYAKPWFKDAGNRRSVQSIFPSEDPRRQKAWVSRLLPGEPLPMGEGFEGALPTASNANNLSLSDDAPAASGSGERWILFKLNIQLGEDDGKEEEIVIYSGDVAGETATQFCIKHGLSKDFIPVLTDTIQQQMDLRQAGLSK